MVGHQGTARVHVACRHNYRVMRVCARARASCHCRCHCCRVSTSDHVMVMFMIRNRGERRADDADASADFCHYHCQHTSAYHASTRSTGISRHGKKQEKCVAFGWLGLHTAKVTARQGKTRQIFRGGCGAQRDRIRPPVSCRHHRRYSLTRYLLLSFCHSDTNRPASSSARACSCSCSCSRSCASQPVLTVGQSQHGQSGRGHHAFMLSS